MSQIQKRVLIVGSGPAGMSAAFFLSLHHNLKITVAERLGQEQYDRYHGICGGGISKEAFRRLKPMAPAGILNTVDLTDLVWPDGTVVSMRSPGYILDRNAFLTSLKVQCLARGVEFIDANVISVNHDSEYFARTRSGSVLSCDVLIGADGYSSIVRRDIFGSKPRAKVAANEFITDRISNGHLTIRLDQEYRGTYLWDFPHGDFSCTGGMSSSFSEQNYVRKGSRWIPFGGIGKIVKDNCYLLGDAAAMANPVTYGGLRSALISGKKVAAAINNNKPGTYQKWWDTAVTSDPRFMVFHDAIASWSNKEYNEVVGPFRHGGIFIPGAVACFLHRDRIELYFGAFFAFSHGW
jgi:flavin-dependent dehydrogenase